VSGYVVASHGDGGAVSQPDLDGGQPLRLRPVHAEDLYPVAVLQEVSILALGAPIYGEAKARAWARLGYQFRHDLLGAGGFWVAERGERLLGVGGWSPDSLEADLAWIRYLFVHPRATREGIGRRLVERAESSAHAAGRPRLQVWSSLNAVPFYHRLGYREVRPTRWPVTRDVELDYVLMARRMLRVSDPPQAGCPA
jgi:putative acetyltransferase